jgi:hypothetical protein
MFEFSEIFAGYFYDEKDFGFCIAFFESYHSTEGSLS